MDVKDELTLFTTRTKALYRPDLSDAPWTEVPFKVGGTNITSQGYIPHQSITVTKLLSGMTGNQWTLMFEGTISDDKYGAQETLSSIDVTGGMDSRPYIQYQQNTTTSSF